MSKLSEKTLQIAATQMGVEEVPRGSNGGPDVNVYLKAVGLGPGYSWCMAFVFWCTSKAAMNLGVENKLVKTGGVLKQWHETALKKVVSIAEAEPGDIFIMDFGHGNGHTGFVERIEGSTVHTIEGNTNDEGSREGYEVARRQRTAKTIKGFIKL